MSGSLTAGPYESAVSIKLTPSSTARRSTRRTSSGSLGSPQIPFPVIRMAPKPSLWIGKSPPIVKVPLAAALMVANVVIQVNGLTSPPKVSRLSPCYNILLRNLQRHGALNGDDIVLTHRTDQKMGGPRLQAILVD